MTPHSRRTAVPARPGHPAVLRPGPVYLLVVLYCFGLALALSGCGGSAPERPAAAYADQVVVKKSQRKLQLLNRGQVIREYRITLGDNPNGHKMQEGD